MESVLLSGGRPTGKLHLGHYVGAFKEYVKLQQGHQNFLVISDMHMLTTAYTKRNIESILFNSRQMIIDLIAMGVNPLKTNFYLQSAIFEMPYLYTLIQNFVKVERIIHDQHTEEMLRGVNDHKMSLGLLAYPVMEAADIILLQANIVTVGRDNIDHVVITNEIIESMNQLYGVGLNEVSWITTDNNYIRGTDGKEKMSKSLDNCIYISDSMDSIKHKVFSMPWSDKDNLILEYITAFSELTLRDLDGIKEPEAKMLLTETLVENIKQMQERAEEYQIDICRVDKILAQGTEIARSKARKVLEEIRIAMGY